MNGIIAVQKVEMIYGWEKKNEILAGLSVRQVADLLAEGIFYFRIGNGIGAISLPAQDSLEQVHSS